MVLYDTHMHTHTYTEMSNICQHILKCGSNLLKNWQICYTLHIQIYFHLWAHARWPRPTSLHVTLYNKVLPHAVQTHMVCTSSHTEPIVHFCMTLTYSPNPSCSMQTLAGKQLIWWTSQCPSDLLTLTFKLLPHLGKRKMEALPSIQGLLSTQDVCLHENIYKLV